MTVPEEGARIELQIVLFFVAILGLEECLVWIDLIPTILLFTIHAKIDSTLHLVIILTGVAIIKTSFLLSTSFIVLRTKPTTLIDYSPLVSLSSLHLITLFTCLIHRDQSIIRIKLLRV